jgi:hypothetical protein
MEPKGITKSARMVWLNPEQQKAMVPKNMVTGAVQIVRRPADWEDPSLMTKAMRLRKELLIWGKAGLKLAPKEIRSERLATCKACEYFDPTGNLGLGQCRAPGCGCTKVKAALLSSRCPKAKWRA